MNGDAIEFDLLPGSDLTIDRTYRGGVLGTAADDPLARLQQRQLVMQRNNRYSRQTIYVGGKTNSQRGPLALLNLTSSVASRADKVSASATYDALRFGPLADRPVRPTPHWSHPERRG